MTVEDIVTSMGLQIDKRPQLAVFYDYSVIIYAYDWLMYYFFSLFLHYE